MNTVWSILLWSVLGGLAGHVHFTLLAREARAMVGDGVVRGVWLGRVLRLSLTVGVLWLASRWGAWPLLAALAGLLVSRQRVLRTQGLVDSEGSARS